MTFTSKARNSFKKLSVVALILATLALSGVPKTAIAATSSGFTIRGDGFLVHNGVPTFLFGFNHVSDIGDRYGATMAADFEKMGAAGFNLVQPAVTGLDGTEDTAAARAVAQKYGMYIIGSFYRPSLSQWLSELKSDPTILGWNTNDDFNAPYNSPKTNPDQAKAESDKVKNGATALGYETFTFGSGGGYPWRSGQKPYVFGDYKNAMDIFAVQSYPISNNDDSFAGAPMEENIAYVKYAQDQLPANKPLFLNLQTFAWGDAGARYPNASEGRNMVWAGIVHRVEGILGYAYHEESGTLPSAAPALWSELVALRRDINGDFLRAYINGKHTCIDTTPGAFGTPRLHAATWEYENTTTKKKYVYVVVLNTSSGSTLSANNNIQLPASVAGLAMNPLVSGDARYGTNMTVAQNGGNYFINGSVAPEGVQVYVFQSDAVAATPTPTPGPVQTRCVVLTASTNSGTAPLTVNFSVQAEAPGSSIDEYEYNFGDNSEGQDQIVKTNQNNFTHVFHKDGTFVVTAQARDSQGNWLGSGDCQKTITVGSQPKVLVASALSRLPKTGFNTLITTFILPILATIFVYLYRRFKLL